MATIGVVVLTPEKRTKFEELALGKSTISFFPEVDEYPIHISDPDELESLMTGWEQRGSRSTVLWLGNSQLHAINQANSESAPASAKIFDEFDRRGIDVLTWSFPNANLEEQYLAFEHFRAKLPMKAVILPVVFDDFRESGVRDSLTTLFDSRDTCQALAQTSCGRSLLKGQEGDPVVDADDSLQQKSEEAVESWLASQSKTFENRGELRGLLFSYAYVMRNRAFGITAQSVRKKIPGRYALNMDALQSLLKVAVSAGIEPLVYVVPLRQDVQTPYQPEQYRLFKDEIRQLVESHDCRLADLDELVPGQFWGQMADVQGGGKGFDFMHFQEDGHRLLATEVADNLAELIQTDRIAAAPAETQL